MGIKEEAHKIEAKLIEQGKNPEYIQISASNADEQEISETYEYAFMLIDYLVGALEVLSNAPSPLPEKWKSHIKKRIFPSRRGRPKNAKVQKERLEMAVELTKARLSKTPTEAVAQKLAERFGYHDAADVYKHTEPYENAAIAQIADERIDERYAQEERKSIAQGQRRQKLLMEGKYDAMIQDGSLSFEDYQAVESHRRYNTPLEGPSIEKPISEKARVIKWIEDAATRRIPLPGASLVAVADEDLIKEIQKPRRNLKKTKS